MKMLRLRQNTDATDAKKNIPLAHMGHDVTVWRADIEVDSTFIIELKVIQNKLSNGNRNQLKDV